MAYKDKGWLWILFLSFMNFCNQSHVTDNILNIYLKQPDIRISDYGLNYVNISWGSEVTNETAAFDVCYVFSFNFLNKTSVIREILNENYRIINLRLHPGFRVSVTNALCKDNEIVEKSNPSIIVYNAPKVYIDNVSCAIYNVTNLNCTWDWKDNAPEDTNYSFALRLGSKWVTCKQYFQKQDKNIGCHMKNLPMYDNNESLQYKIRIRFSNHLFSFTKTFRTQTIEILNPPINISVSHANEKTKMEWYNPPSVGSIPPECFQYEIRVTEAQTNQLFKNITGIYMREYIFSDLDKDKKYSVHIRAKKNYCEKSKYWGKWSKAIFIGKDEDKIPAWILILLVLIMSASFVILVVILFKRYMKILFVSQIPDPSKKIQLWLSSNYISSEGRIAEYKEQSVPITEIEIVTSLRK